MKNYKNIRSEPYLYGFTISAFFAFVIGSILCLMSFIGGFSLVKFIVVMVLLLVLYAFCKYVLSNKNLINRLMDNKLPKKHSEYE